MYSNKLKMLGQLYRKDMHQVLPELTVVIAISIVLDLWMLFGSLRDGRIGICILPMFLTLGLAALLPLVSSFKVFNQEWNDKSIYLLMSLPASGSMVIGSKLLALFSQYLAGTLVVGIGSALSTYHAIPSSVKILAGWQNVLSNPELYKLGALIYLLTIVGMLCLFCNSFLSQMLGRLSRKFSGLVTAGVFILIVWLVGKITGLAGVYLPVDRAIWGNLSGTLYQAMGWMNLIYLLITIILFISAVLVYDRYLEL